MRCRWGRGAFLKIIHISDTHIGSEQGARRFKCIIEDIHQVVARGGPWWVVHTGDLIDKAVEPQRALARQLLAQLEQPPHGPALPVLLVPGNHDYGCSWHTDWQAARDFKNAFAGLIFGDQPHEFPVLRVVGRCAFIGLDSSAMEFGLFKGLFAKGELGQAQLDRLNALLNQPELAGLYKVVCLHHHPFIDGYSVRPDFADPHFWSKTLKWHGRRFLRLKDANSLVQILRDRIDLLLFGHRHYGLDHRFEAQRYGIGMAFDASSTTAEKTDADTMRYRIIDIETSEVLVRRVPVPRPPCSR